MYLLLARSRSGEPSTVVLPATNTELAQGRQADTLGPLKGPWDITVLSSRVPCLLLSVGLRSRLAIR